MRGTNSQVGWAEDIQRRAQIWFDVKGSEISQDADAERLSGLWRELQLHMNEIEDAEWWIEDAGDPKSLARRAAESDARFADLLPFLQ